MGLENGVVAGRTSILLHHAGCPETIKWKAEGGS
jgi:hypothetical protein